MLMSKAQQKSGQSRLSAAPLVGRFAPTPSGFLHLGNVFCSLLAWLYAKKSGGKIVQVCLPELIEVVRINIAASALKISVAVRACA